jgi:hypothetical protein
MQQCCKDGYLFFTIVELGCTVLTLYIPGAFGGGCWPGVGFSGYRRKPGSDITGVDIKGNSAVVPAKNRIGASAENFISI